ncbi:MAG: MFS transporter [Deltaproteobacteria bacterium]|nr:MFS transporter [Deltaproteobacteria bacterium]
MTIAVAAQQADDRPFPLKIFLFAFFGWTFDFYDLVLLGFLKEHVGHDLHLTHSAEAWMLGVALGTSGLGGIVAGALADRIGKRTMLASTILLYSLGSLVAGLAPNITVFLIGRGLVGLGVGGEWAIGHALVAEAIGNHMRGRGSALLQSGEPVGVALAAVAGYLITPLVGWRWVMIGSSATALLALAARRSMHLPDEPAAEKASWSMVRRAGIGRRMLAAWVLGVFKLGTYWTCYTWLPGFLLKEMNQGVGRSFAWVLTAQIGQLSGMLLFGQASDRIGRRPSFTIFSLITAVAIGLLAFRCEVLSATPVLFWGTMLMLGLGSGCTAGFGALLAELFPTEVRGLAMGTTYNLARSIQVLAPVIVSWAVLRNGLSGGLGVPLVLALATATWVWVLPETRGIELPRLAREGD